MKKILALALFAVALVSCRQTMLEDRITLYQQAWKRIKKIKEEGFFRGDIPTKSFPVEKKDTLALRHAK